MSYQTPCLRGLDTGECLSYHHIFMQSRRSGYTTGYMTGNVQTQAPNALEWYDVKQESPTLSLE